MQPDKDSSIKSMTRSEALILHKKIKKWEYQTMWQTGADIEITYYTDDKLKFIHPEADETLMMLSEYSLN